jgi:hypothetical protein
MKEKSKAAKDVDAEENAEKAEMSIEVEENNEKEVEGEEGSFFQK